MKTDDIRKMGLAYVQVLEAGKKTMDPVNPAELKGTHAQRKDKDIDNDGKVDSSDEYLHKRRQAISKSMKKEEVELDELKQPSMLQKAKYYISHGKTPKAMAKTEKDYAASKSSATLKDLRIGRSSDNTYKPGEKPKDDKSVKYGSPAHMQLRAIDRELKKRNEEVEQVDEVSRGKLRNYMDAARKDMRSRYYNDEDESDKKFFQRSKGIELALNKRDKKAKVAATESADWPVFARIMEKRDQHVKGATPPEPINSKASQGEKDFVNMHGGLNGNDSGIDGAKAAADTIKAAAAQVKTAPKRPNDQTIGDKTMPKPKM